MTRLLPLLALLVSWPAAALDVLILYDTAGSDTGDLEDALTAVGHTVDYGDTYEYKFDGTNPSLSSYDVVVHLNGASAYTTGMKPAGQTALESFVYSGGGLVAGEYNAYEAARGRHSYMDDLLLLDYVSDTYGTLTITPEAAWEEDGLFADVSSISVTGYYTEAWTTSFTSEAAEVVATESGGYDAIAVREWGSGRAVHFAWAPNLGASVLADTDVLQMYVNAVAWASGQCDVDEDGRLDEDCGGSDCDDSDADVHDLADEICDGQDNDCDGVIDSDAVDAVVYYYDYDGDTYGDPDVSTSRCEGTVSGYVTDGTDCDDTDASVKPGADEYCDWTDNDCDGEVDEDAVDADPYYADDDGDGYGDATDVEYMCWMMSGYTTDDSDCSDRDPNINPGADEVCDEVDQDCDGDIDEDAVDATTWYRDLDRDGYGNDHSTKAACEAPSSHIATGGDCNDYDPNIQPMATEIPYDGIDQDCDGRDMCDLDGDGHDGETCSTGGDDCDDEDPTVYPGATDAWYDGVDSNCDGRSDYDADRDGYDSDEYGGDDCDDTRADVHPGATEVDDGLDNDCDGISEDTDTDGDGLPDFVELELGTDPSSSDSDGDGVPDDIEVGDVDRPRDEDRDGVIDAKDDDDDGDGIPTRVEIGDYDPTDPGSELPDQDQDGIPNHLDRDSDNDGRLDAEEGTGDYDCDGLPDYLDVIETDGDCYGGGNRSMGCRPSVDDGSAGIFLLPLFGLARLRRRRRR